MPIFGHEARLQRMERKLDDLQRRIDVALAQGSLGQYEKLVLEHGRLTDKYVELSMKGMGRG